MTRYFSKFLVSSVLAISAAAQGGGIPERIDGWRVEVGAPGNEYHRGPVSPEDVQPPLDGLLRLVEQVAPAHAEVRRWEQQAGDRYFIRAEAGPEEYDFVFSSDGVLLELDYDDEHTNTEEQPGEIILPGSRRAVPLTEVPKRALESIAALLPESSPRQAWHADSLAGPRYVVLAEGTAFFARPDGQLQAAGLIERGALAESRPRETVPTNRAEPLAEAEELLGRHRDRFDFARQIERLGQGSRSADGGFRFVVLGDSRSNPELWTSLVKHVGLIDPPPRFVINTGDIVYRGYVRELAEYFVPSLLATDLPIFVAIGNHDDGDNGQAAEYRYLFGDDSLNYFFDYGGWRFVFVDNATPLQPFGQTLDWLEGVLKAAPERGRIVVSAHKPIANVEKWAYHSWEAESSERFAGLMSKYEVAHVFFGHIHAYSTARHGDVGYTVAGGAGAGLHNRYGPQGNVHHYIVCDVQADGSLRQQVVRFFEAE
jgi:3',5'-cyclic AMP phosphodiesterase CpdA